MCCCAGAITDSCSSPITRARRVRSSLRIPRPQSAFLGTLLPDRCVWSEQSRRFRPPRAMRTSPLVHEVHRSEHGHHVRAKSSLIVQCSRVGTRRARRVSRVSKSRGRRTGVASVCSPTSSSSGRDVSRVCMIASATAVMLTHPPVGAPSGSVRDFFGPEFFGSEYSAVINQ